jgi:excisionase family DNA binding protein
LTITEQLKSSKGLLSVREVAEALGSHIQTIYSWVEEGKLPCFRVGGRIKFDGTAVADWLDRRTLGANRRSH